MKHISIAQCELRVAIKEAICRRFSTEELSLYDDKRLWLAIEDGLEEVATKWEKRWSDVTNGSQNSERL